ncbi:MAG: flagellar assembly protein FliW [bacterium]|nr:flagellar assembly protein FliW [bacterium]
MTEDVIRFSHVRFGEQEVEREKVITFPDGIPGFESYKQYALFEDPESQPFQWLLSTENPQLGFVVVNPTYIWSDYSPKISRDDLTTLEVQNADDLLIFSIITLADDPTQVTANLSGPIVINSVSRKARQLALFDDRYATKHKILGALQV